MTLAESIDRLRLAHRRAAALLLEHDALAPIFERLDEELAAAESALVSDPVAAARMKVRAKRAEG
jgi:hypothetical protein